MRTRRIVMALWDGGGVVPPLMEVVRRLSERGHTVRVVGDPTIEAEALAAGGTFSSWRRAPHRTTRDRDADIMRDYAARSRREHLEQGIRRYFYEPGEVWTGDVLDVIDQHAADIVLADNFIPWGILAAQIRQLPSVALHTLPYSVPTPGMTPIGAAMVPVPRWLAGARDTAMRSLIEWVFDRFADDVNRVRSTYGMPAVRHALDQLRQATAQVVLTSRMFDHGGAGAPSHVFWAGSQLADPLWCEPWMSPWPASDTRPLVLVGLSSTYQAQVSLLKRLVDALAALPVRALLTVGPTIRQGEVIGRDSVVVVQSAPHSSILPETAVLVTHAGHGTVMKGLAAGVPMVCVPMGRDQDDNAARVAAFGAGVRLNPSATTEQLKNAVASVLDSPRFRESARRLASAIEVRTGEVDVVNVIESIGRPRDPGNRAA